MSLLFAVQLISVFFSFVGTLYDVVHRFSRSHLLVVSYVPRRKGAKSEQVWDLRGRAVVGRGM